MRVAVSCALLGALIAAGACYAYRQTPVAPVPGARVRIILASRSIIAAQVAGREDTRRSYDGVLEARGRIEAAAGDTVVVRLGDLRTAAGAIPDLTDQVAFVPTAQIARIEVRRFQAGTTLIAGFGIGMLAMALAMVTFLFVVLGAMFRGF